MMFEYSVKIKNSDPGVPLEHNGLIFHNPISKGDMVEILEGEYEVVTVLHECGIHGKSILYVE